MIENNRGQLMETRSAFARQGRASGTKRRGQALLELALVTPFLIMLMILAIDFGGWLYCWAQVGDAARAVGNYASLGLQSVGSPAPATGSSIVALLDADLGTLPNYSSGSNPAVLVCRNNAGTITPVISGTTCTSSVAADDPESGSAIAISVDLTYTFTPLIASFTFSNLGIHLPSLPTTIHRRVVMRYI